jgi:peroxin-11B
MSQNRTQGQLLLVLDSLVKLLAQTAGKDKIAKLLQYGGKFINAWAAARAKVDLAAKAKKIEGAASAARKVFRLGNELAEVQKIRALLKTSPIGNPLAALSLTRSVGMYWYWVFDHLVWAANIGLAKLDATKYAYYGSLAWCVGLISTILIDLQALKINTHKEKALQVEQWNAGAKDGRAAVSLEMKGLKAKKNEILLNCVKNLADLFICVNLLKLVEFSQGKVGVLGLISGAIGTYQLYPSAPH